MQLTLSRAPLTALSAAAGLLVMTACADPVAPNMEPDAASLQPSASHASGVHASLDLYSGTGSTVYCLTLADATAPVAGPSCQPASILSIAAIRAGGNTRWHDPLAGSNWVGPDPNSFVYGSEPITEYWFRREFTLPENTEPSGTLDMRLYADNDVIVYLNGPTPVYTSPQGDIYTNYGCVPNYPNPDPSVNPTHCEPTGAPLAFNDAPVTLNEGMNFFAFRIGNESFAQGNCPYPGPGGICLSATGLNYTATVDYSVLRGNEGCTPGYWKNHSINARGNQQNRWPAAGLSPTATIGATFGSHANLLVGSTQLLEALDGGGGSTLADAQRIMFRAAVAALLNARHSGVDYYYSQAEIMTMVQNALIANTRSAYLSVAEELDRRNNAGCPLN